MKEQRQDNISEEKEIDLQALGKKIWLKKKFILEVVGIGFIFGLVVAFSIPKEYTTTVLLTPDSQSSNTGTMGSLAALAGININNTPEKDALASPNLYPTILSSTSFLSGLLDVEVKEEGTYMPLKTYMREYQKHPWWSNVTTIPAKLLNTLSSISNNAGALNSDPNTTQNRYLSPIEMAVIESLSGRFNVNSDKKTGITTVEVTMQNPEISAFLADTLTSYLQTYIIKYRTEKARRDLQYAEKLYQESKENYYKAQASLAAFVDGNINVVSASYRTTQERLQNEVSLTYSIYNQTAQQLQMAKIKVQNTTPVFTIVQSAVQPLFPVKPQKKIIVIGFVFLSFIGSCIWILKKDIKTIIFNKN